MGTQLLTAKRAALEHFAPMNALGRDAPPSRLQDPVVGVGVGGSHLRIYVDASSLHRQDVPQAFGDVYTEVIETSGFVGPQPVASVTHAIPPPPVSCGVSIGLALPACTGTLGCLVQDGDGCQYLLSNNHVFAATNLGVIGDPIVHPGPGDGSTSPANDIAALAGFQPIDFTGRPNHVDAAIGKPIASVAVSSTITGLGRPSATPAPVTLGQDVRKHGRTTRLTTGTVCDISFDGYVQYGKGLAWFEDQIGIVGLNASAFSAPGDSGALILESAANQPIGLLFAGDDHQTLANPIDLVLAAFHVSVVGD